MPPMPSTSWLLVALIVSTSPQPHELPPLTGWIQMRSPNFQLVGDVSERELHRVASRLERFRAAVGVACPPVRA